MITPRQDLQPLFQHTGDGVVEGFAIELFEQVAARAGLNFTHVTAANWQSVVDALSSGSAHISPALPGGIEAPGDITTGPVFLRLPVAVFSRRNYQRINDLAELAGQRVGIVALHTGQPAHDHWQAYPSMQEAFFGLLRGEVDALLGAEAIIWKVARHYDLDDKIQLALTTTDQIEWRMAVSGQQPELPARLQQALLAYMTSDHYAQTRAKWFHIEQSFWNAERVFWAMSALLVLVAAILIVSRQRALSRLNDSLHTQIEEATRQLSEDNRHLEDLTITDTLTGIGNRRSFENNLIKFVARAERYDEFFAMLIFDIDNFKRLNDTYGHAVGDEVLHEVANRIVLTIRAADLLCRWGGEEFTILMPNTDRQGALDIAERCRLAIMEDPFGEAGPVTISLGVTCYAAGDNERKLFKRADDALRHSGQITLLANISGFCDLTLVYRWAPATAMCWAT